MFKIMNVTLVEYSSVSEWSSQGSLIGPRLEPGDGATRTLTSSQTQRLRHNLADVPDTNNGLIIRASININQCDCNTYYSSIAQ